MGESYDPLVNCLYTGGFCRLLTGSRGSVATRLQVVTKQTGILRCEDI